MNKSDTVALTELQEDLRIQGTSGWVGSTQEKGSNGEILSPSFCVTILLCHHRGENPFAGVKQLIYSLQRDSKASSPFPSCIWKSLPLLAWLRAVPSAGLGCAQGIPQCPQPALGSVGCQRLPQGPWDPQHPGVPFKGWMRCGRLCLVLPWDLQGLEKICHGILERLGWRGP